ncbi:MAG: Sir2 family NAD-dependent protein deacetylase [Bacteroidota bacterium]
MKKIVVLSGAGISAESGIRTFRDAGGLWEGHDIMEVASPQGWYKNPELVLDFYNKRRRQLLEVQPNQAHLDLQKLEETYQVVIVTQNVDDLHERAGSTHIIHLHGELLKARSTKNASLIYERKEDIHLGDSAEDVAQLRPHIVWFGEEVPMIEKALQEIVDADYLMVIGTSLQVYPAAGLIDYVKSTCKIFVIDPHLSKHQVKLPNEVIFLSKKAVEGVAEAIGML